MSIDGLREFVEEVAKIGGVKVVEEADWNLEVGTLTELQLEKEDSPVLLFDNFKGFPAGYRVATNLFTAYRHAAIAYGLPENARGVEMAKAWRDKLSKASLIPPVHVDGGVVKDNVQTGDEVDLYKFPTPKWHELDGGRYIGTGVMVIQKDPDDGLLNLGTYRVQIHDKDIVTVFMSPGRDGHRIRKKYWDKGESCPVAIACGQEPLLWQVATWAVPHSEYDVAGGLKGKPIEVTSGVTTDLPIPATAEIVLEGEMLPPEAGSRVEGPFGEWPGYYATSPRPEPLIKINAILHRNHPILMGMPPTVMYARAIGHKNLIRAGEVWHHLDQHIPGVKGVWQPEPAYPGTYIVSIEQQYPGHAQQAAALISSMKVSSYMSRNIIIVDDDIDPSNFNELFWALNTRFDPETQLDVLRGCRGSIIDPRLDPEKAKRGEFTTSKMLVIACKPFHWIEEFPIPCKSSPELKAKVRAKWSELCD